ncbi:ALATS [Symbiodinium necroappetens]|uniref:ALATS protein n=1 Tax=Symbiodinium necroappetens TaxID=1628268 RepID=A0A812JJU4_9DINO|nr:ALATS [Symbiodinium necroappetens]
MAPAGASEGQLGVPVGGGVCRDYSGGNGSVGCPDKSSPVSVMFLRTVELVVWPEAALEIRRLAVMAPAGYWQQQVDIAPWPARSAHVAVTLPEGDILLMGGVGEPGLLNDVWRWTPRKCTLLEDMQPLEAARFGLECSYKCTSSPIYGQWAQLLDAPWAPRSEPGAVWTASGVILAGGRSSLGYENDVWVWQHSGDFCSVQWQGTWTQLTPQAAWFPRHGHRLVGFVTPGSADVDTVLLVGGFGGEPDSGEVIRGKEPDPADRPNPRNDIWCGNKDLSNWGKWTQIAPTAPFSARAQFAAVIAPTISDFSFVLFGGYDDNARLVVDQWQWTGENTTFRCEVQESTSTEY